MKEKTSSTQWAWYLIGAFVVFLLVGYILTNSETKTKANVNYVTGPVVNDEWDGSVKQAKKYLKERLKDPSSYDPGTWYKVVEIGPSADFPNSKYGVKHEYRAKNSYGAYDLHTATFIFDASGNVIHMESN